MCEKNSDTQHDFDNDPIKLIVDTDAKGEQIVRADETTLGADNGIGLAMGFAARPPTRRSSTARWRFCARLTRRRGMTGAKVLTPDFFAGRRLLNLDSEGRQRHLHRLRGCGCDTTLVWSLGAGQVGSGVEACRVHVAGLRGGHSGGDIHLNRANAIRVLVQTLQAVESGGLRLADLNGGSLRNAIAREASAVVVGPAGLLEVLKKAAGDVQAEVERVNGEAECSIEVAAADAAVALSEQDTRQVLAALTALPHGTLAVVPEIAGLVQTSNNVATVRTEIGGRQEGADYGRLSVAQFGSRRASRDGQADSGGGRTGRGRSGNGQRVSGLAAEPGLADAGYVSADLPGPV